jgi:hypothetical protein
MFDARHFLHHFIQKAHNPAGDKKGTEITQHHQKQDDDDEAQTIIPYMHQALVVFKGEDGDEAINTAHY